MKSPETVVKLCGCPEHHKGYHCPACHGTGYILPERRLNKICLVCNLDLQEVLDTLNQSTSKIAIRAKTRLELAINKARGWDL